MTSQTELIETLTGQTISEVDVQTDSENSIHTVKLKFANGVCVEFSPTSYNYGGQHLVIDIN